MAVTGFRVGGHRRFRLCAGLLAAIALRRRSASLATLAAWVLLAAAFMTLFRESGLTSNAGRGWAAIAVLFGAGVIAIALTRSPARA